jgi:hypothetical protein
MDSYEMQKTIRYICIGELRSLQFLDSVRSLYCMCPTVGRSAFTSYEQIIYYDVNSVS